MTRLSEEFKNSIKKKMMEKFDYKNFYSIQLYGLMLAKNIET